MALNVLKVSLWILIFSSFFGCSSSDAPVTEVTVYKNDILGWTMPIPDGWRNMTPEEIEHIQSSGSTMLEDFVESEITTDHITNTLHVRYDQFNLLQSYYEEYTYTSQEEWDQNLEEMIQLLGDVMRENKIHFDQSRINQEMIDGIPFKSQLTTIYGPTLQPILYQLNYYGVVNGKDLTVNINYNSDLYKRTILGAWKSSSFNTQ